MTLNLEKIVKTDRITTGAQTISSFILFLYFPIGVILAAFRICLTINFLCAQILFNLLCFRDNMIRRAFERLYFAVLGIVHVQPNMKLHQRHCMLVANKLTNIDGVFLSILCNCSYACNEKHTSVLRWLLRIVNLHENPEQRMSLLETGNTSLLVQPESYPTCGAALLKFRSGLFDNEKQIQPMTIKLKRPFPISGGTLGSSWVQDLLWTYFCPLSVYEVKVHPVICKESEEAADLFRDRVRKSMSQALGIPCSNYDASDVEELIKRKKFESRRPQQHLESRQESAINPRTKMMAKQVKDILPHVPLPIILSDLVKTKSVDVTVANILEGVVKFVPETSISSPSTSQVVTKQPSPSKGAGFSRNAGERHMTLQEKKEAFLNKARENYLKKHGLQ
ncbi:lipid droplet-regulating VLDL assembly factor AUP1-like isoform X2 [Clavelina lepadiformis]|uniref:lipid droplet-regulating VLDL assembly factor AUP1-like isoform X2 n=1 Tax=Clavelina lepadiformis TaxID=159417 RepID=UPI0040436AFE